MKKYPFHLITGSGRGVSYSSLTQVRDLAPGGPLGQAEIRIFYNLSGFNMSVADHVLKFPEINHPILLGYFFNSQCASVNTAWRLPVSSFKPPSGGATQFTFIEVDGHETPYTLQSGSKLYMAPGHSQGTPYLQLNESTSQWFRYHPGTEIGEIYDKSGTLIQRRDRWGNQTNYGYDQTGMLSSITGPSGTQYLIGRSSRSDGSRSESIVVVLTNGYKYNVQGYEFDKNGLLITSYTSYNGQDLTNAYTTTYSYYSISPEPQIDSIRQSDGTFISFDYDTVSSGHYRLITIYLSQGAVRVDFNYSAGKTTAKVSGASGWQADYGYDAQSRITQVKQYTGYSSLNTYEITQYQYANDGHLQTIIYPDNSQETFTYSYPFGMRIQHQKPNGQQRNYNYDEAGNRPLLQSIIDTFPGSSTPVIHYFVQQRTYNNPNPNYPENETDYLLYKITPQGRVTAYDLYSNGLVQYQRAYLSGIYPSRYNTSAPSPQEMQSWCSQQNPQQINLSTYSYYGNGLQCETIGYAVVDNTGAGIGDQQMSETTQYWDIYGKLLRQVKQEDRSVSPITTAETLSAYDGLQRTLQTIDPLQNTTAITYQTNTDKQYTGGVYAIALTQPNGRVEKTILNDQGEKIYRAATVPEDNGYSAAQTTQWYQDGTGRPTVIYLPDGRITFQLFDQDNRIGFTVSATGLVTEHQWDNIHNSQCDIVYENPIDTAPLLPPHDPTGNTIRAALTPSSNDRYTYRFYDASRRLRFEVDANNQVTETQYDILDRITAKIRYATPLTDAQLNTLKTGTLLTLPLDLSQDRCTSTYYDLDSKVIGQIDPDGWVTENKLDCAGQLSQQILYATPNRNPRSTNFSSMRPVSSPNDAITYYFRNARGQVTVLVSPEGFVTAYQYYASMQVQQKMLFYNKVDPNWYQNTTVCPPLPAANSEDQIKNLQYDLLERTINLMHSDGAARYREYTNMGKLLLERHYDSRYTNTAGNSNPDQTRTVQYRYDGWDNIVQTATPLVSQLMAQNPDQTEQIWSHSSVRDQYDDVTAFKLKSTNTLGNTTLFYYDQERRPVLSISPTGAVKQLTYNNFNDKIIARKYSNKISSADLVTLTGGFVTQAVQALLKPDESQDIIEQFSYDKLSQKINTLDPENYQSTCQYNTFGETIAEHLPLQNKTPSLTIYHTFNPRGKEIITKRIAADNTTLTTQQNFENCYGQLTSKIDETGALTQYFYDREGVQVKTVDALNVTSHQYTIDALKRVLTDTDAQHQVTRYQYTQQQRATAVYPPVNNTQVTTQTNIFNQIVKRTDALGAVRTAAHAADGHTTAAVNELGLITQEGYDTESRHTSHIDPIGIQTVYTYDNDNYLITQTQIKAYQNQDIITNYTRDTFGRAIFITNPRGMITQQLFSQRSLVLQKIRDVGTANQLGLKLSKIYAYNGQGSKINLMQGDAQNSNQYAVSFLQDGFNRAMGKIIDQDGENPLALTSRQSLDGVNRTISYTDAAGRVIRLFYDALGHKRFAVDAVGGMIEWQYNALELKSVVRKYEIGLTASELAGLTDQTTLDQIETLAATKVNAQDIVKYFFYDANKREQFTVKWYQGPLQTYPQGIVTQKVYDGASRLIQTVRYSNSVDATAINTWTTASLSQLMAANTSVDDRLTVILLDAAGQQCFAVDPRGVINEQRFDALGRIISKIHYAQLTNPQTIAGFSLTQMSDYVANNIANANQDQSDNTVFNVFDKAEYIVKTTVAPQCAVTQYPHDLVGNLTGTIRYKTTITFSNYDNLLQQLANLVPNPAQGDRITTTAYDLCDRVINDTDELGYHNIYGRDALDNQISRTDRAGFVWQRSYDRGKRLVTELTPEAPVNTVTVSGSTLTYVEKNRSVKTVYGYDGVNNLLQKTVDADGDEPRAAAMTFWIHNQQNSITVQNVEVDDPSQTAHLIIRPTTTQNVVTQTIFNFKLQTVVEITEQGAGEFSVYDSLGRLAYKIDKVNGVTAYTRNNFDEVIVESKYATPLKVDLTPYLTTGVPISVIAANLIDSNDDRHTVTERDKSGNPITTIRGIAKPPAQAKIADLTGLLFYFQPSGASGFYYTQHDRQFDAFNNIFRTAKLITPIPNESWSQTYQWFDGKGNVIASAEAVQEFLGAPLTYRVNRIIYDAFYQKIQEIRYAGYMPINPQTLTLAQLDDYLAAHTSAQDRIKTYQYDLRGCLIRAVRMNVNREDIASTNPPTFKTYNNITLTESYQYDPRELKTLTIHEALPGKTPTQECLYYDSRGFERAHAGIAFTTTTEDDPKTALVIAPLIDYGINAHGQKVRKIAYINGASQITIDPQVLPTPLSPSATADRLELKQTDTRGKISAEQDPNQRVTQSTYTLTGQITRSYWQLTNPGDTNNHPDAKPQVHVDEKRQSYDLQDRVILIDLRRDNVTQQQTAMQYNAFGETVNEGPGNTPDLSAGKHHLPYYLKGAQSLRKHIAVCADGQPKFFTEYLAKAGNDWEFKALGVSRTEAVKILFAVGDNPQVRQHIVAECCDRLLHFQASPQTEIDPTQFMAEPLRRQFLQKLTARTKALQPALTQTDILDDGDDKSGLLADKRLFKAYVDSFCVKGRPGLPLGVATMCIIADAKRMELNIWSLHKSTGQLQLVSTTGNNRHPAGVLHLILRGGGSNVLLEESTEEAVAAPAAVAPGKSSKQWPLYRTMDQVGRLINTNDHKSCEILFYDLSGAQTAELLSPTQDLSIVEQANFPSLLTQPYTEIEKTQFVRDPAKRLLAQILPEYTAGTASQPQYAPAEILASTLYPALGAVSLSWVTPKLNAQPVFTLYPTDGSGNKIQRTIQTDPSGYSGVDVSDLATGFYNLEIDYYLMDPTTGLPTTTQAYYTDGQVYFPTANNDGVTVVVPTVQNDHVLWLTGAVSSVTDIDLVNASGVTVNRYALQKTQQPDQKFVDLSAETSGHYTVKLISNGIAGVTTPVFIINTVIVPLEAILSREIPAQAQINLADNQNGTLSLWQTLPLDYQLTPVQIICLYVDDKGNNQTFTATLKPDSNQTAALLFDYPVQIITALTLSLQISTDEIVPLYLNEAPQTASPVQINFTAKRIVYIRGQAVAGQYPVPPTIQFKDVSQGIQATWKSLPCIGTTIQGIAIDMSYFAPGNYPFILPYGDESNPYVFTIALGAQVFDSNIAQSSRLWVKLKDEPLNRQRLFQLDVFKDNVVASTDTLGYTTSYQYNDLDQEIKQIDPLVTIVNADGSQVNDFQGITITHRNVDGVLIGVTLPAGNSQAYVLNEQNRRTQWILGDGLVSMAYRRDGFNRSTIIYDCRSKATQRVYDPVNMIQQIVPNSDDFNDYGRPLVSVIGYNEKNQRVLSQDPAQNQTLYRFTITGDIAERINPRDDMITTTWDRNHQKLAETWASGKTQQWTPDHVLGYFSVMNSYKDLGDTQFTYEYDWKLQQIVCQTKKEGWRGYTAILTSTYNSSNGTTTYGLDTSQLTPGQNLRMTYDAGRLIEVNDVAQGYHTVMDYDSEDRPVLKQVYAGAQSRWSARTVTSTLDALGREIHFFDTLFSGFTQYDANGNRRRRYGQVMAGPIVVQADDNWYNYDHADRPIAVDCGFSGGAYQLTKSSSMLISYERDRNNRGLRYQETAQDELRQIEYFDDGDIKQVDTFNVDGTLKSATDYHYHPAGYRASSTTSDYENNAVTTSTATTIICDADVFQTGQTATSSGHSDGSDGEDDTTLEPDRDNNILEQNTVHKPTSGDQISYELGFRHVLFEDTYQLSIVSGTTYDQYGSEYTEALMYYDSNGTLNGKVGADNDDKDTDGKLSVYNVTTYDGLVIEKYQFPTDPSKDIDPTIEYYFYDIHNNYLSSYTVTESSYSTNDVKNGHSSSIKMRFQGVKNSGKWGHCDLDIQPRTPRQQARFNAPVSLVRPINTKIKQHGTHPPRLYASASDTDNTDDDNNTQDDGEFVQSINNIDLLIVPDKYTVKPGDTFTSIAQSQYGDASFAEMIAIKNNYPTVNDQPSVCSVLNLPQYIPMSNKFNNNLPYNTFQNAIYGNLYPPLIFVQPPPPKQDCTQTLILVACAVVAIAAATTVVGGPAAGAAASGAAAAAGTGAAATGAAVVTTTAVITQSLQVAVLAGALDASLQGVAVGVGALKQFSVDSVIETAVSAGMFYGVNAEWSNSAFYVQVLAQTTAAGATDLSSQLIEMAVGTRKRLDINQTLYSMATAAVNAAITAGMNMPFKSLGLLDNKGVSDYPGFTNLVDDFINAYTNAFLGSAIMGGKVDLNNALGQALGSYIGQEISTLLPKAAKVSDATIHDYFAKRGDAVQLSYNDMLNALGIHDLTAMDYANSLTIDDIQAVGTDQLPAGTGQEPNPFVSQPNSYNVGLKLVQHVLDQMLTAKLGGYDPSNGFLFSSWGSSTSSLSASSSISSGISQWLYNNQTNWEGQAGLYLLQKTQQGFAFLASILQPTAEMNPIISSTNALWGQDILNNNRLLSSTDRIFYGINAGISFLDPLADGINTATVWAGTKLDSMFARQLNWIDGIWDSSFFDNASWSSANFLSPEKLEAHFLKHAAEFNGGYSNQDEYLGGAQDVIDNGIKILQNYYAGKSTFAYVRFAGTSTGTQVYGDILKPGYAKFEFVGTDEEGNITTYGIRSNDYFWKTINGDPNMKIIIPYEQTSVKIVNQTIVDMQ